MYIYKCIGLIRFTYMYVFFCVNVYIHMYTHIAFCSASSSTSSYYKLAEFWYNTRIYI